MFKRIDHSEAIVSDIDKTIKFYTEVLGFTLSERMAIDSPPIKEIAFLKLGDTMMELIAAVDAASTPANPIYVGYKGIALEVENMDECVAYLKSKDVAITWGPISLGSSIRAEICDPDGLTIELRQWGI
ncbi:MAG: VOC family protein [Armatimonadota bacterium]